MAPSPEPDGDESEAESRAGDARPSRRQPATLKGLFTKDRGYLLSEVYHFMYSSGR